MVSVVGFVVMISVLRLLGFLLQVLLRLSLTIQRECKVDALAHEEENLAKMIR